MSIASQPLPGVAAVEEHNDVDHSSVSPRRFNRDSSFASQGK